MSEDNKPAPEAKEFVVAPDSTLSSGKPARVLYAVGDLKQRVLFELDKVTKGMVVGHVYAITVTNEGKTFNFGGKKWLRQFERKDLVVQWQTEQLANEEDRKRAAFEKKHATPTSELANALHPIRAAYLNLAPNQRAAFEAWLLRAIRRM